MSQPVAAHVPQFAWGQRTVVMAILNCTPDSFTGLGPGLDLKRALRLATESIEAGAEILDIGGESSRPGAAPVSAEVEMARVLPLIKRLARETGTALSIDTTKPEVARAALRAGATIVNDTNGLRADPAMAATVAGHGAMVVAMANLRNVKFTDVVAAVAGQFRESLAIAEGAGIPPEHVILDPGFGFGPSAAQNIELLRRLGELRVFGRPLLVGASRKWTIGRILGGLPVEERLEGTAATVALAIANGADLVRVHDTRAMTRVARVADAIVRGWTDSLPPADHAVETDVTRALAL